MKDTNNSLVNILVIDDDPKVSWILSEGLGTGYCIDTARDGKEGINKISKTPAGQASRVGATRYPDAGHERNRCSGENPRYR